MSKDDKALGLVKPKYLPINDRTPAPRQPARKNTRRWCKGKAGREHVPEIALNPQLGFLRDRRCQWTRWTGPLEFLCCNHVLRCTVCGKILKPWLSKEECPDAPREDPERHAG